MFDFWRVQSSKLLFPEIEWSKPEQKSHAGKLLIIGGGAGAFRGLAIAHKTALRTGVGEVRILLPNSLKKDIKIDSTELILRKVIFQADFQTIPGQILKLVKSGQIQFCLLVIQIKILKPQFFSKNSSSKAKSQFSLHATRLIFF